MTLRLGTTNRRLDPDAVKSGVRKACPYRPGLHVTLLPAAHFNARWQQALAEAARRERARGEDAEGGVMERLSDPQLLVDAIVADMDGIYDEDGEEVEYTPELGLQILSDEGNRDVADWIASQAFQWGHFYTEEVRADEKNSGTGSSGKKAGAGRSTKTRRSKPT